MAVSGWRLSERVWMGRLNKLPCHLAQFNPHYMQEATIASLSAASFAAQSPVDLSKILRARLIVQFIWNGLNLHTEALDV